MKLYSPSYSMLAFHSRENGFYKSFKFTSLFLVMVSFEVWGKHHASILSNQASLLSFRDAISFDPKNALQSWNSSNFHVCNWLGVRCNNNSSRIVELDLHGKSLGGIISPSISNLSFLIILDLSENFFEGKIPAELGSLLRLEQLSLSSNLLEGKIPTQLGYLHQLIYLDLGSNRLTGKIPWPLLCNDSSFLQYLDLSNNSLTGFIPLNDQSELKELMFLLLWSNKLVGQVPQGLSNSSKLRWIDLESNFLSGGLPSASVGKMPQLQFLYLSYNSFISHDNNTNLEPFFVSLANSSSLEELEVAGNKISGELPPVIGNLSTKLKRIHLENNLIYGPIPPQISNLINLTVLKLSSNLLNGSIP